MRRQVHGAAHVDRAWQAAQADPHEAALQTLVTEAAWGRIWSRPDLPAPTRSLVVIAMLMALGRTHELDRHIRSAVLRNGCTMAQVKELALTAAAYAGIPAGVDAMALAKRIEAELTTTDTA
ncbi:carboxymuconolactone decarboxylase family protein [Leptolyngbya sp. 15MV]|nr:carboxymuconolactone decarboxylase family protein [Leptolyngbya sp. 15MV]